MKDVWSDIPSLNNMAKERTGYPTQKPLALLRRIIHASSHEGNVVRDPFCGCATTCVAADQSGRRWVGIDIEGKAADLVVERLSEAAGLFRNFVHRTDVTIEDANAKGVKQRLFEEQQCQCNGCQAVFAIHHFEVDHVVSTVKGRRGLLRDYQLLCGSCNRIKGNRPMAYLNAKILKREEHLRSLITFAGKRD